MRDYRQLVPTTQEWTFDGFDGQRVARTWPAGQARYLALLCHGYGEHIGRYEDVARTLTEHGGTVCGVDHVGHGKSAGERVMIEDFDQVVGDFHVLADRARADHPGLPVLLIGHSMGGLIGTRFAQRYTEELAGLVLSGPVLGRWDIVSDLLAHDPIPATPIDPQTLSRDPAVGKAYQDDPLVWHGDFRRPTLLALQSALDKINNDGPLGDLPTLWIHGEDDQLVPIGATREGVARVRSVHLAQHTFPGARHEVFNEINRDEVLAVVTRFIDATVAAPRKPDRRGPIRPSTR